MGRSPRIQYYGAMYHISHEGKCNIFKEDEDKTKLLEILENVKEKSDFIVLAYSILDNRYDFLIKFHNIPVSKCMQKINMEYTKYYNSKYNHKGRPYKNRYKSIIIEDERKILDIIWEIHRIPIEERFANSLDEYKWTSDVLYKFNLESIVDIGYILNQLDDDRNKAMEEYTNLMKFDIINNCKYIDKHLDQILKDVCNNEIDFDLIKEGSKKTYLTNLKKEYIIRCKELGYVNSQIGDNIGITDRAVRKYLETRAFC
ncbi:MAG: transposase [Tissierellia bacterium]|nr:transposase [Tissierellia bacterium]